MPRRSRLHCRRWLLSTSAVVLLMGGALGEGETPPTSGETPHPTPESLTPSAPPATPGPPKEGETSTPTMSPAVTTSPPVPPTPTVVTSSPTPSATAALGASPPLVTPHVTENPRPAPASTTTTMASNTTTPSTPPPSSSSSQPFLFPPTEAPHASSEIPLAPPLVPNPTLPNDTIHFVPTPATTVPVPHDASSTNTASRDTSHLVSYSAIGGSLLVVIVVVIGFLFVRRNRESKFKPREDRTLAMSEMFLSSREGSTPAHVLQLDMAEDLAYTDSMVSHEVEDDASSQASIQPSSPASSIQSDPCDSYRSSYFGDTSNSLAGFMDDPPLSDSSDCSSTFYGHDSVGNDSTSGGYDSDVDL